LEQQDSLQFAFIQVGFLVHSPCFAHCEHRVSSSVQVPSAGQSFVAVSNSVFLVGLHFPGQQLARQLDFIQVGFFSHSPTLAQ
jgi:hypothetical protein